MNAAVDLLDSPTEIAHRELADAYRHFNDHLFDGELPMVLMTLQRTRAAQGMFMPHRFISKGAATVHEVAINPQIFAMSTIKEVLAVVVHEMAKVYTHQQGTAGRRGYHSSAWADKMESIGLMPSTTGAPGGKRTGERVAHYIIPGGPFDVAADALIANGYTITWLDRIAAHWYEAESAAEPSRHRVPLGSGLLGKVGLLVPGSDDAEDPELDDGGAPASGENRSLAREANHEEEPVAREALDWPSRPDAADPSDGHGEDQAQETAPAQEDAEQVILSTGSKRRGGEVPTTVELITTEPKQSDAERRKRKEKARFVCPSCDQRAWAKPTANIKCGACDLTMTTDADKIHAAPESAEDS